MDTENETASQGTSEHTLSKANTVGYSKKRKSPVEHHCLHCSDTDANNMCSHNFIFLSYVIYYVTRTYFLLTFFLKEKNWCIRSRFEVPYIS